MNMTINHKLHKLLVTLQLTTKCPCCQQYFYKPNIVKGLTFCPHCDTHLIQPKVVRKDKHSVTKNLRDNIISSACSALVLAVAVYFHDQALIKQSIGYLDSFFIFLLCGLVVWSLVSIFLKRYQVQTDNYQLVVIGQDTLEEVELDACDSYCHVIEQATTDMNAHHLHCTECGSQRVTSIFWFKRILAKTNQKIPYYPKSNDDISEDKTYGCLNCQSIFKLESRLISPAEKLAFIFPAHLLLIALLAVIFNDEAVALFHFLTANRLYLSMAIFIVFFSYSLLAATYQRVEDNQPNNKLIKIGK